MSNLEHLLENGLLLMEKADPDEWKELMKHDINWNCSVGITLDQLWTICQYITYTWED